VMPVLEKNRVIDNTQSNCRWWLWVPALRRDDGGVGSTANYAISPFIGLAAALSGNTVCANTRSLMPR
jgi:hypothetical protein